MRDFRDLRGSACTIRDAYRGAGRGVGDSRPIIGVDSVTRIVTRWLKSSIIDTNRQSIVDFDGESSNSTACRGFVTTDRHFVTARRRFRRLIVDFDERSSLWSDWSSLWID